MEFSELNLHPDLQKGIAEADYTVCMPVQEQVLANAFGGQDLYVQSQTGTGKTAAFLIVIFQRLLTEELLAGKKAIIMVPTRELAVQVEEEAKVLGKYLPFKIGSFYGGVGYTQQQQLLRDKVQILVGTPGRVLDLNKSGHMNLMDIAFLVLDEADRMFDMGFYPDLRKLIKVVPPADRRQTMLFSATLNAWVKNLAWEYTKTPFEIEIAPEIVTVDEVQQSLYHVPSEDKMKLLLGILEREKPESAIIFCNTKRYTEIVAKRLRANGYECEFIIGDLPQTKRLKIIEDVKAGTIRYLAATDVAARGLDIEGLARVVNYDLPSEAENYVHRIGRTARAGKTGRAVTLASEQDVYELPPIERYIGKKIPSEIVGEDLYAEDKSAGMNIRAETYGERFPRPGEARRPRSGGRGFRHEGRDGGRGGASGEKPRSGDRYGGKTRAEHSRPYGREGRTPAESRGPSEGRSPAEGRVRAEGRASGRKEEGRRRGSGGASPDLSRLSAAERMTYYKQKYGQGQSAADGRAGAVKGGKKPAGGGKGPSRAGAGRGGRNGPGKDGKAREHTGASASVSAGAPSPSPKEKKGLFARIAGLFGKK
ncbi:MAG: DEAD/DEAH box helicase [Treponema sp.]|jgi:ATP-dependent RNA helicase RhlB|nr:DEAD/DEAH box helicase [Treponema sp.]